MTRVLSNAASVLSLLQQQLHKPYFTVLFMSIFWRVLLRGLFIHHLHDFIFTRYLFASIDFSSNTHKAYFSLKMSLFLCFSSTYMHRILEFSSSLYSKGFYWGVCSLIYTILIPKNKLKCIFFCLFSVFFWFMHSEIKVQKLSLGRYLFKRYTFVPIRFKYVHFKY